VLLYFQPKHKQSPAKESTEVQAVAPGDDADEIQELSQIRDIVTVDESNRALEMPEWWRQMPGELAAMSETSSKIRAREMGRDETEFTAKERLLRFEAHHSFVQSGSLGQMMIYVQHAAAKAVTASEANLDRGPGSTGAQLVRSAGPDVIRKVRVCV